MSSGHQELLAERAVDREWDVNSVEISSVGMESSSGRRRMGCLRQENACLTPQDEELTRVFNIMPYELASSKSQVRLQGPRIGAERNVTVMSEQIRHLEAEMETKAEELREAELRAECSMEAAAHSEIMVANLTEELNALREELVSKTAQGKRAEQQRNQALENAEKLKEAFKNFKATTSLKLQRVMENENRLKGGLMECDREKEELEIRCSLLEREKAELSHSISQLKEDARQATTEHLGLQAQLEDARKYSSQLEGQLSEQGAECRDLVSLRREVEDLRTLTKSQEQRLLQSHKEAEQKQTELSSLEAILTLLHLREGGVGMLCARPCTLPPMDYSKATDMLRLKPGEGYQQLLRVLQSVEAERTKRCSLVERLQERLNKAQEEISSLQSSMAQKTSHYQSLHTELRDRVSQATDTEKELKRKTARVAALEKQLQEKTSAYSLAALKNTELEKQLLEKTNSLQHYQSLMAKKQKEYQQSLDKCKKSHEQQNMEQQHRLEMLQLSVEESRSRVLDLEQQLSLIQSERDMAQSAALLLQASVDELTQEKQAEMKGNQELLQTFKEQTAQSTNKVCELQESLTTCREELRSYLQRMDDEKKKYETELQKRSEKVSLLQEKLHSTGVACQNSGEQNLQLQLSLQQQQTMLTESTSHIAELEESQSQLQKLVSTLEQQLERARAALQEKLRKQEQDSTELHEMKLKNVELSETNNYLTSEMTKCQGQMVFKESELQHLRSEVTIKASQITRIDENLQHTKTLLERKNDMVTDLEEKLHRSEADRLNSVERVVVLEGQLQAVRRELAETLMHLQELKDVLQRTQTIADERQASVKNLTMRLSETQRELEERTHEVLDMDNALKERQGELQQRAKLLGQLDVAIKDHKQEMELKVDSLQRSLEARERELRETQRELTERNMKDSHELGQQLHVFQQKLQTTTRELGEARDRSDALIRELQSANMQVEEKNVRLCRAEEDLARLQQTEAKLQNMVTSLEQELELEKEQHSKELDSLEQTRGQLLKVSEQISVSMRSTQEQLTTKLKEKQAHLEQTEARCSGAEAQLERATSRLQQSEAELGLLQTQLGESQTRFLQSEAQLETSRTLYEQVAAQNAQLRLQLEQVSAQLSQARVQAAQLQAELHSSQRFMETSNESLLIKESEVTRLQARISSLERAAERHNPAHPAPSLPALPMFTHLPELSSTHSPLCPPHPSHLPAPPPPADPPPAASASLLSDQTHDWLQGGGSSVDSSLDLPPSVKATLKEALRREAWESSADHSWEGLSGSFDPLTYVADAHEDAREGAEERMRAGSACEGAEPDMSSLTGMLHFVNQTLARQEDPLLWSSGHGLQSDKEET